MKPKLKLRTWDVLRGAALQSVVRSPDLKRICKAAGIPHQTAACVRFYIDGTDVAALSFVFVDGGTTPYNKELIEVARRSIEGRCFDIG